MTHSVTCNALTASTWSGQVLRTKLLVTDDSFEFNRVLGRLKTMVAALPVVSPDDERELQVILAFWLI